MIRVFFWNTAQYSVFQLSCHIWNVGFIRIKLWFAVKKGIFTNGYGQISKYFTELCVMTYLTGCKVWCVYAYRSCFPIGSGYLYMIKNISDLSDVSCEIFHKFDHRFINMHVLCVRPYFTYGLKIIKCNNIVYIKFVRLMLMF